MTYLDLLYKLEEVVDYFDSYVILADYSDSLVDSLIESFDEDCVLLTTLASSKCSIEEYTLSLLVYDALDYLFKPDLKDSEIDLNILKEAIDVISYMCRDTHCKVIKEERNVEEFVSLLGCTDKYFAEMILHSKERYNAFVAFEDNYVGNWLNYVKLDLERNCAMFEATENAEMLSNYIILMKKYYTMILNIKNREGIF